MHNTIDFLPPFWDLPNAPRSLLIARRLRSLLDKFWRVSQYAVSVAYRECFPFRTRLSRSH